jgi:hypothetical protein
VKERDPRGALSYDQSVLNKSCAHGVLNESLSTRVEMCAQESLHKVVRTCGASLNERKRACEAVRVHTELGVCVCVSVCLTVCVSMCLTVCVSMCLRVCGERARGLKAERARVRAKRARGNEAACARLKALRGIEASRGIERHPEAYRRRHMA